MAKSKRTTKKTPRRKSTAKRYTSARSTKRTTKKSAPKKRTTKVRRTTVPTGAPSARRRTAAKRPAAVTRSPQTTAAAQPELTTQNVILPEPAAMDQNAGE